MDNEYDCKANMLDWSSGTPQFTSPLCAAAPAKLRPSSSVWQAPRNMAAASADNSANSLSLVPEDLTLGCFGTNLTQRAKRQGYRFFVQGYLHKINITDHHGEASVSAKCFRSMRKSERPHSLRVCFDPAMKLINISKCSCKAGLSGRCSHLVGLVQALMHYQQWGMKEIPTEMSCTELQQRWGKPRGKKIKPESVMALVLAKVRPDGTQTSRPVTATHKTKSGAIYNRGY